MGTVGTPPPKLDIFSHTVSPTAQGSYRMLHHILRIPDVAVARVRAGAGLPMWEQGDAMGVEWICMCLVCLAVIWRIKLSVKCVNSATSLG
jgi:hypothetical protein